MRVLIVDENRIFRETFGLELLKHFAFMSIQDAKDGREAMEKIHRLPPSLIFMDICLPGLDGLRLTQKIKEEFPGIRVAVLTGYDFPEYRKAAIQNGADAFFVKDKVDWGEIEGILKSFDRDIFQSKD
jgi:YesN/AraC family two-component response regulator